MRNKIDLRLRKEEINLLLLGTAGHLNGPFVPAIGHLPVCFKNPNTRWVAGGGGLPGGMGTTGID